MHAWQDSRVLIAAFVAAAFVASVTKYYRPPKEFGTKRAPVMVTHYNNYLIFKNAALHLASGQNLYRPWPSLQWDQFKYSPSFAGAMWPLAQMPDLLGLCLWNMSGALALLLAIRSLPLPPQATAIAAWLVFKDQLTSAQNAQSNGLVAALMILTFICWERRWLAAAALALVMSLDIKIFGVAIGLLWIVYPQRIQALLWCVALAAVLAIVPLALTSPENLWQQYQNWYSTLHDEFPQSEGISVMGILHAWFGISGHKTLVMLIGCAVIAAPLLRISRYRDLDFRLGLLASTLIWVVLFNHRAESATFVIATAGVAIWFVSRPMTRLNIALAASTLILSGFSSNDLMPQWVQQHLIEPYHLKALPSLLVWFKLQGELWSPSAAKTPQKNEFDVFEPAHTPRLAA